MKGIQVPYIENYKILPRKIKDLSKLVEIYTIFIDWKIQYANISILPKFISRLTLGNPNIILIKFYSYLQLDS